MAQNLPNFLSVNYSSIEGKDQWKTVDRTNLSGTFLPNTRVLSVSETELKGIKKYSHLILKNKLSKINYRVWNKFVSIQLHEQGKDAADMTWSGGTQPYRLPCSPLLSGVSQCWRSLWQRPGAGACLQLLRLHWHQHQTSEGHWLPKKVHHLKLVWGKKKSRVPSVTCL